eukprot:3237994-Prymnesium_polylepis.1
MPSRGPMAGPTSGPSRMPPRRSGGHSNRIGKTERGISGQSARTLRRDTARATGPRQGSSVKFNSLTLDC